MVCIVAAPGVSPLVAKLWTLFCQKPHVDAEMPPMVPELATLPTRS